MKKFFTYVAPALTTLGLALGGCQTDITEPKATGGDADFSKYIAVGNSLTAGYADGGLYLESQQNSYPSFLAQQFKQVGGGDFAQPLFPAANSNGSGYFKLNGFDAAGNPQVGPEAPAAPGQFAPGRAYISATLPFLTRYTGTDNQNLGVPGIRIADVTNPEFGALTATSNALTFNPYFERLLPANNTATTYLAYVQERVATVKPTFFTNWLGNNDVLGYAASGGVTPLTSVAEFSTKYAQVIDALTANGAKGLVANISSVTSLPFFTTIPVTAVMAGVGANPVPDVVKAQLTAGLSLTAAQAATIRFALFIRTGRGSVREANANDLILLTSRALVGAPSATSPFPGGFGIAIADLAPQQAAGLAFAAPANPLPNSAVLDAAEVTAVAARTYELNTVIYSNALRKNLAHWDANTFFTTITKSGLVINGVSNTTAFITGNLFSLDGVHPTPRGYAVVANEMIKVINVKYSAHLSGIDATTYRGVKFP